RTPRRRPRNITEAKGVRAFIYHRPKSDRDALYVGLNDRDKAWHDVYKVKISTGERALVAKNTDRFVGLFFDLNDQPRLAMRSAENGDTEFLRMDTGKYTKIYSCGVLETCVPIRFHKDNKRVYMMSNKGDNVNFIRLMLLDPETGKTELVESDPQNRV